MFAKLTDDYIGCTIGLILQRVLIMYDLVFFYPQGHEGHYERGHPERPERVETIRSALEEHGYWSTYPHLTPSNVSEDVISAIHTANYLRALEDISRKGMRFDADTYTTPQTWDLANKSTGGAVAVSRAVWSGEAKRGFALTRPPGHHATPQRAMGFCLLNNVALAAEDLIQMENAHRLAIIDLDLHHGNGTQDIFFSRGDVFYISTHQYPHYPGTGWLNETGDGSGEMKTANFPLPPYSGDLAFFTVMDEFILPLLDRYQPEMVLVSYGFDPHFNDPLGNLQLTSSGYGKLIASLASWADENCQGRISLFLEGGYDLQAAESCSLAVVAALLGEPIQQEYDQRLGTAKNGEPSTFNAILEQAKLLWEIK
jgi:acetoin utilization deacetylase AcuC-like enzyme